MNKRTFLLTFLCLFQSIQAQQTAPLDRNFNRIVAWYEEQQAQSLPVASIARTLAAGTAAALWGTWAAQNTIRVPQIRGTDPKDFIELFSEPSKQNVRWWQEMAPGLRALLVGVIVYTVVGTVYDAVKKRVEAVHLPQQHSASIRSFIQQWPQNRGRVDASFHPLFDRLYEHVNEYGISTLPPMDQLVNGISFVATLSNKKNIDQYVRALREETVFDHHRSQKLLTWLRRTCSALDVVVPFAISVILGSQLCVGDSVTAPLIAAGVFCAVRIALDVWVSRYSSEQMRTILYTVVKTMAAKEESTENAATKALLAPLVAHAREHGAPANMTRSQAQNISGALAVTRGLMPRNADLVNELLEDADSALGSQLKRIFSSRMYALAAVVGMVTAASGRDDTGSIMIAGVIALLGSAVIRWWQDDRASHARQLKRAQHLIAQWPRYKDRLPAAAEKVLQPLHDVNAVSLSAHDIAQLRHDLLAICHTA